MFQADPSVGTDHLRNSIEDSLSIQKKLWGHISGLMQASYIVDIPDGGGKAAMVPNFQVRQKGTKREFQGWDGVRGDYISPETTRSPVISAYEQEWQALLSAKAQN